MKIARNFHYIQHTVTEVAEKYLGYAEISRDWTKFGRREWK